MVEAGKSSSQTGELPSSGPIIDGTPLPDAILRPETPLEALSSSPKKIDGWKKVVIHSTALASTLTGGATILNSAPVEANGRMLYTAGSGDTIETFCTPEYIAQYSNLIVKGGPDDVPVAGESTSTTTQSLAQENPDTASIDQPSEGTVLVNFTDIDGNKVAVILPNCPPEGQNTGNQNETEKDQIDIALSEWTTPNEDGQYNKVPIEEKYKNWKYYANLNIMPDQEKAIEKGLNAFFQGSPRGFEKIVGSDGKTYLIAYIGQELKLGRGDQYSIALNMGEVSKREDIPYFKSMDLPPTGVVRYITPDKFVKKIKKDKPQVIGFGINGSPLNLADLPPGFEEFAREYDLQTEVAKALIEYSAKIQEANSFEEVPIPEILKYTINMRCKDGDDISKIPMMLTPVGRK